eukprot:scaffold2243_cov165-Amphora_coffeaeformis.AAC.8
MDMYLENWMAEYRVLHDRKIGKSSVWYGTTGIVFLSQNTRFRKTMVATSVRLVGDDSPIDPENLDLSKQLQLLSQVNKSVNQSISPYFLTLMVQAKYNVKV